MGVGVVLAVFGLLPVLLTFGAIDALVPVLIIIILIAAAATLNRGWNALNVFGISFLAGVAGQAGMKGTLRGKSTFTGGKAPGRGYSKTLTGGIKATQGAVAGAMLTGIKAGQPTPGQAKAAIVESKVRQMKGESHPLPSASTNKVKMAIAKWTGHEGLTEYHKTLNALGNAELAQEKRLSLMRQKAQQEEALRTGLGATAGRIANTLFGNGAGTAPVRPVESMEELAATPDLSKLQERGARYQAVLSELRKPDLTKQQKEDLVKEKGALEEDPVLVTTYARVEKLKEEYGALGQQTLARISEEATRAAELAERQKALAGATVPGFAKLTSEEQQTEAEKLVDRYLYSTKTPSDVKAELDRIPVAVAAAYASTPTSPVNGLYTWAAELGVPRTPDKTTGVLGYDRRAVAGYLISSVATVGIIPLANIAQRQYHKWHMSQ